MNTKSVLKKFNEEICKNCENKDCPDELRIKLDGSLKCDEYKRKEKPIGALIRVMRIGD